MNFLSIFVLIPLLMLAGLWAAQGIKAIRGVMVTGASALFDCLRRTDLYVLGRT